MKYLKSFLIKVIAHFTLLTAYILFPIVQIKFGRIYSNRLGHLGYNLDNYISFNLRKRVVIFFFYDEPISNKMLFNLFKKKKNIIFSNKIKFLYFEFLKINPSSKILVSYKNELHPKISFFSAFPKNISTTDNMNEIEEILKKNKIENKFICIHNRDDEYLSENNLKDENYHSFRNYKIEDLKISIEYLIKQGFHVVRVGKINNDKLLINSDRYIDLTGNFYNEKDQLTIIENCYFFIGCNSGITILPRLFRKPSLLINYIPFNIFEMTAWSKNSIFLPKKIYTVSDNRCLNFKEMNNLNYNIHNKKNFFEDKNLLIKNNTKDEILKSVIEMVNYVNNDFKKKEELTKINDNFWNFITNEDNKNKINGIRKKLNLSISGEFIKDNKELVED